MEVEALRVLLMAGRAALARGSKVATQLRSTAGRVYPEPAAWGATMCRAWAHPAEVKLRQRIAQINRLRILRRVVDSAAGR